MDAERKKNWTVINMHKITVKVAKPYDVIVGDNLLKDCGKYITDIDKKLQSRLKEELGLHSDDIYKISGPIDLTFLMKVYGLDGFDGLKKKNLAPQSVPELPEGCEKECENKAEH